MKWEYHILGVPMDEPLFAARLNALGALGWELISSESIISPLWNRVLIFKRPASVVVEREVVRAANLNP